MTGISILYLEQWNPWLPNVFKAHHEHTTGHQMPYMDMIQEERCVQNLPENLKIIETILPTGRHRGVFCGQRRIAKGTRYGPYTGNIVLPQQMGPHENNSVWEVSNYGRSRGGAPHLIFGLKLGPQGNPLS